MFHWKGKLHLSEKGQGLVEYALILALVSIIAIGILAVLGDTVLQTFCKIVMQLDPGQETPMCAKVDVNCAGSKSGNNVSLEAQVTTLKPGDTVSHVDFYVDGRRNNTERTPIFCLVSGDARCNPMSTSGMSPGTHTIRAAAFTTGGATGVCEYTFTAP